jgi:hypothetical protein
MTLRRPLRRTLGLLRASRAGRAVLSLASPASRQQTFAQIYASNAWGTDGDSRFYSGIGSRGQPAEDYVRGMTALIRAHEAEQGRTLTIVDIGCGDFAIGRALLSALPHVHYIGCDIVPALIAHHQAHDSDARTRFQQLDIVTSPAPAGDICLVRQVLQHLSNAEIAAALRHLEGFPIIYVTEGQPEFPSGPRNPDKQAGQDVRFDWRTGTGRGVELDQPPFGLACREMFRSFAPPHEVIVTQRLFWHTGVAAPHEEGAAAPRCANGQMP